MKRKKKRKPRKLRKRIERHLGVALDGVVCISHEITPPERVNLQRALDRWLAEDESHEVFGYSADGYFSDEDWLKELITDDLIQAPLERAEKESGPDESLDCVIRGTFLFRRAEEPIVLVIRPGRYSSDLPVLEVVAAGRETARDVLAGLREEAERDSVYKGRSIAI